MRVLLTNDDGVESEGIGAVRVALAEFSDRVVTVAPEADPARRAADVSVLTRPGRRAYPRTVGCHSSAVAAAIVVRYMGWWRLPAPGVSPRP